MEAPPVLDHSFDVGVRVAGHEQEGRPVRANPLVLLEGRLDAVRAARVSTLADEVCAPRVEALGALCDSLVDVAEQSLIAGSSDLVLHRLLPSVSSPGVTTFERRARLRSAPGQLAGARRARRRTPARARDRLAARGVHGKRA